MGKSLLIPKKKIEYLSVLVVDDSQFDRDLLIAILRKVGIQGIQVAENGSIASNKIENAIAIRKRFDIIFLDSKMPSQDGPSLLRRIRADQKLNGQIVIITTGSSNKKEVKEYLDIGIQDFIIKPVSLEVLKDKISAIANSVQKNAS